MKEKIHKDSQGFLQFYFLDGLQFRKLDHTQSKSTKASFVRSSLRCPHPLPRPPSYDGITSSKPSHSSNPSFPLLSDAPNRLPSGDLHLRPPLLFHCRHNDAVPVTALSFKCTPTFDYGPFKNLSYPFTNTTHPANCGMLEF
jgi:hypothetical protein